jgi:hypothetical protein
MKSEFICDVDGVGSITFGLIILCVSKCSVNAEHMSSEMRLEPKGTSAFHFNRTSYVVSLSGQRKPFMWVKHEEILKTMCHSYGSWVNFGFETSSVSFAASNSTV